MKMVKYFLAKILLLAFFVFESIRTIKLRQPQLNQLFTYPNLFEAPTMADQIPKANFTAPPLSRSLFEEDPQRKLRMKDFVERLRYAMYNMTRGETEQIFVFADKNHDDLIDQNEWDAFSALFVYPFEACDTNGDYLLNDKEFKNCWDSDSRSSLVLFRRRYANTYHKLIMRVVSTKGADFINFADYLVIRRSMFAWKECHSAAKFISINSFRCALRVAIPHKYHMKLDADRVYRTGLSLSSDKNLIELDYVSYLRIIYHSYVFTVFNIPFDSPFMEKTQFIKAVREDRLPTNFEEQEIEWLYQLVNTNPFQRDQRMNFESFSFFFNLHRLFNRYSIVKPLQIREDEIANLLEDELVPLSIVLAIDMSKTNYTENQYQEVSMVLQRLRLNERDFYFSFKQDASEFTSSFWHNDTIMSNYYTKMPNMTNRHFFYTSMCGIDKRFWTKDVYYRTFQFANLFTQLTTDKTWLVSPSTLVEKLPDAYETTNPPISQLNRNNYDLYKSIPREIKMDLLTFLIIESYKFKLQLHMVNTNSLIDETMLKIILHDFGMSNMPDPVIDISKKGFDALRRRVYKPLEVLRNIAIVHSAAGENVRNLQYLTIFKIKPNKDYSRKFTNFPRKYMASPLV